ncbi:MAG TPA: trypsin-like peptidase domain-containing protein [Candidatus Limnocylindria bacterium]|nr:trypsin-like peptidase domain-containing protein [Candidatus Limnocylindria bacterium]
MTERDEHDAQPAQPEILRYGPPPRQPARPTWDTPAWSGAAQLPAPRERRGLGVVPVVTIALVTAIVSGSLSAVAVANLLRQGTGSVTNGPTGSSVGQVHIDESSAVITAVARVMPAVVVIRSTSSGGVLGGANGTGSGFIFDPDGWILTNKHVVDGADEITVTLNDSRIFSGRVYGIDTLTDLAIVKIDATGLPIADLGSSEELELGQLAIAIGNPLGNFENTVTTGVVSGLGRQIQAGDASGTASEQLNNLIQTDAAINPGNSGGPLINSAGQVIGINTAVNQDAQGIGFAIPISIARPIAELALAGKPIERPWIGVYYKLVDAQVAKDLGLAVDHGVLVDRPASGAPAVFAGSPADEAGLVEGDIVVAVDGDVVDQDHDLSTRILPHVPGDTVTLSVVRDGRTLEIAVTLGTLPTTP